MWAPLLVPPVATGLVVALLGGSPEQVFGLASIAGVPLIAWAAVKNPAALVGAIVFALILEEFELATPIATISPGSVGLLVFLAVRLPDVVATLRRPGYGLATLFVCAYVAAHALQFLHVPAEQAARQMVTAGGFAAFVVLGMYIGSRRSHLSGAGAGAIAGLLVLAILALVANLALIPGFHATAASREIFGFASPFTRSYGLRGDTVGLLLALGIPWLACTARFTSRLSIRVASVGAIALVELASLLLFQSRSMVLECALGSILVWAFASRTIFNGGPAESTRQAITWARDDRRTVVAGLMMLLGALGALVIAIYLAVGDRVSHVSTQLRTDSYGATISYLVAHPWAVILGTDPTSFHREVDATLTYGSQISAIAPVHNFIVETLVAGGIVAAGSLLLLAVVPFLAIARNQLVAGRVTPAAATAMAGIIIGVMEASVTPAIANSGALWITLGWGVAAAAPVITRATGSGASISQRRGGTGAEMNHPPAPQPDLVKGSEGGLIPTCGQ